MFLLSSLCGLFGPGWISKWSECVTAEIHFANCVKDKKLTAFKSKESSQSGSAGA